MAPIIFCSAALFVALRGIISAPLDALFAVTFVLIAVPAYYFLVAGWKDFPELRISIVPFL